MMTREAARTVNPCRSQRETFGYEQALKEAALVLTAEPASKADIDASVPLVQELIRLQQIRHKHS